MKHFTSVSNKSMKIVNLFRIANESMDALVPWPLDNVGLAPYVWVSSVSMYEPCMLPGVNNSNESIIGSVLP